MQPVCRNMKGKIRTWYWYQTHVTVSRSVKYLSLKLLKTQANMKQLVTSVGIIFNDSSWRSGITCASLKPNSKDWVMQLRKAFKHFLQLGKGWESYRTENQERARDKQYICGTCYYIVVLPAWQPERLGVASCTKTRRCRGFLYCFGWLRLFLILER